jgi:hypothetical protein
MPKHFNVFRQVVLGYILIVGLCVGLITPIAQAEAPLDTLYTESVNDTIVDGLNQIERAQKIDTFFAKRDNSPLAGYGLAMVKAADHYGIDWRLLPAIATIESNGGHMMCKSATGKNNPFGWGSCKIRFESIEEAIDTVAKSLGGHNPKTARYYKGKNIGEIIDTYNPPSIRHDYKKLVTWAMNKIASTEVDTVSKNKELAMN